jgi:eukaryotic-like serine/threonine-protein kinase
VRTVDDATEATEPRGERRGGRTVQDDGVRPRVLDRYRLVRRIGSGGFGVVWLAEDERLQRAVAVKRIVMHDSAVAARAEREARAAARLAHPGIVALYESGRDDEAVYLVSELVRGRTLADLMDEGDLSDRDVLRIGIALCDALAHAHARGVIHRDVKPGNVIVPEAPHEGAGIAKLTDFGVARMIGDDALTLTGDVVGTLAYMAPEQADGRSAGAEADLYALALVLYEALSGVNPVRARGAAATARRVGARLPSLGRLRRDLPLELCEALDQAVRPRPEQRGTIAALRGALARAVPEVDDEAGAIAGSPLEGLWRAGERLTSVGRSGRVRGGLLGRGRGDSGWDAGGGSDRAADGRPALGERERRRISPRSRAIAALAAGALAAAALTWLAPRSGVEVSPPAGAAAAVLLVFVLPRLGWIAMAAAVAAWSGGATALVIAAAALPTILLLRRSGALWSLPAGAPLLGVAGLAGAWPALAAQAARPWHRAALGALGCWWLALAELVSGHRLAFGTPPDATFDPGGAAHLWPLLTGGILALAALWAAAAVLLPIVVRGGVLAADVVGATAWAAGLGSATQAIAGALAWQPTMRGMVAGAVVAGGLALAAAASRRDA